MLLELFFSLFLVLLHLLGNDLGVVLFDLLFLFLLLGEFLLLQLLFLEFLLLFELL